MELITVFQTFNPAEAQLIRSRLAAAQFDASVANEMSALTTDGYAMAVGGVRVQVPENQAEAARTLLADEDQASP